MRARFVTVAVLAMFGGAALAADLPPSPPPFIPAPAPPIFLTWSGFYFGLNAGGGFATGQSDFAVAGATFATVSNPIKGFTGGVQAGFNMQAGPFVYGLESDFQYSGLKGDVRAPCGAGVCGVALSADYRQEMPWFGTVRGRTGYANAGWLFYLTGGYAYAQLKTDATATAGGVSAAVSSKDFRNGWTVGTGIEVMLTRGWSAKLEYLYLDFGSKTTNYVFTGLPVIADSTRLDMSVVRAGVNYRF